jgi:hypothetical protein
VTPFPAQLSLYVLHHRRISGLAQLSLQLFPLIAKRCGSLVPLRPHLAIDLGVQIDDLLSQAKRVEVGLRR